MRHWLVLAIIWSLLSFISFLYLLAETFYQPAEGQYYEKDYVALLIAWLVIPPTLLVSAFWLWKGVLWARIFFGLVAVALLLLSASEISLFFIAAIIGLGDPFGSIENLVSTGLLVAIPFGGICLSVYTIYVILRIRPKQKKNLVNRNMASVRSQIQPLIFTLYESSFRVVYCR